LTLDIYIVVVERRADAARTSLWIHAPNSRAAKINALRIAGKAHFTVIKVDLLSDMVKIELALPRKKARKKAPGKSGAKSKRGKPKKRPGARKRR
jgi:hypothetical protein